MKFDVDFWTTIAGILCCLGAYQLGQMIGGLFGYA